MPGPDRGRRANGPGRPRRPGNGPRYSESYHRAAARAEIDHAGAERAWTDHAETARAWTDHVGAVRAGTVRASTGHRGADQRRSAGAGRWGSSLTGRAAVLGLVVCALVVSLAYPTKQYLGQRGALVKLTREKLAAEQRVAVLSAQARQLHDPAYLLAQARRRLQYVLPGDTVYLVVDTGGQPTAPAGRPAAPTADQAQPWYARLWGSVQSADRAAAGR